MPLADLVGLSGAALAIVAGALATGRGLGLDRRGLLLVGGFSLVATLVPVEGLPVAGWLRGVIGNLSVASLLLLGRFVLRPVVGWGPLDERSRTLAQVLAVVGGLALYPLTLGISLWDPYRLGYASPVLLAVLFVVAVGALLSGRASVAVGISLAVLAWSAQILESRNLWDAVLDPLVFGWGVVGLATSWRRSVLRTTGGSAT